MVWHVSWQGVAILIPSALFISFGNEIFIWLVLMGLAWLAYLALQLATGIMALRHFMQGRAVRGVIWALVCFLLTSAEPLYRWAEVHQVENAIAKAQIVRDIPDFTNKVVLYVPSRQLDDTALSCADLVSLSGASAVYLTDPWFASSYGADTAPEDITKPIDLLARIKVQAQLVQKEWGAACVLAPSEPPAALDYVLIENRYAELKPAFQAHLEDVGVWEPLTRLRYLVAPVDRPTAFELSTDTALIALFETWRAGFTWPYSPVSVRHLKEVPRDWRDFDRPIRQVVCKEPRQAPKVTCWPFQ
jgi:hypothetical protein